MSDVRKILIKIQTDGGSELKKISDNLADMNKKVAGLGSVGNQIRGLFAGIFAGFTISTLTGYADEITNLTSRLKILAGEGENSRDAFDELIGVALKTRTPIGDVGNTYARIASSLKDANLSSTTLVDTTEALIQTFRLSGATGQEAANASVQLAQALSLGVLRGQDFKSVVSQNAVFASLLTKSLGKTRGELQQLAEAGALKADVVLKALLGSQQKLDAQANDLAITFQGALANSITKITVAAGELNKQFNGSGNFAAGLDFIADHFKSILGGLAVLSLTALPALIAQMKSFFTVISVAVKANPLLLLLGALAAAMVLVIENSDLIQKKLLELEASFGSVGANVFDKIGDFLKEISGNRFGDSFKNGAQALRGFGDTAKEFIKIDQDRAKAAATANDEAAKQAKRLADRQKDLAHLAELNKKSTFDYAAALAQLNIEYFKGTKSLQEYDDALNLLDIRKLKDELNEGKISFTKFSDELLKLKKADLGRQFEDGRLSAVDLAAALKTIKIEEAEAKFKKGKITLAEYNTAILETKTGVDALADSFVLKAGIDSYTDSIKSIGTELAGGLTKAFGTLEDTLVEFSTKGKFEFQKFALSIIEDINRVIIRTLVLKPILDSLAGFLGSTSTTSAGSGAAGSVRGNFATPNIAAAKGAAFDNGNVIPFAKGGLVSAPTLFGFGSGQTGLMGEAGTEAIVPLTRGSDGKLGVNAQVGNTTINIINQAGADVTTEESQGPDGKVIQVYIKQVVKETIANGGFDTAMNSSYGLKRRGN